MGAVYLARDLSLEREVALKVVAAGLLAPEDDLGERFVREARSQARLSHPEVVQICFIGEEAELRLTVYRLAWRERRTLVRAYWPSALFALASLAGLLVAAFDRQRRALHDIVAGTLVTYDLPDVAAGRGARPPPA